MVRPLTTNAVEVQVASAASDPRERSGAAGAPRASVQGGPAGRSPPEERGHDHPRGVDRGEMVRPLTTNAVEVKVASAASDPRERRGAAGPYERACRGSGGAKPPGRKRTRSSARSRSRRDGLEKSTGNRKQ